MALLKGAGEYGQSRLNVGTLFQSLCTKMQGELIVDLTSSKQYPVLYDHVVNWKVLQIRRIDEYVNFSAVHALRHLCS